MISYSSIPELQLLPGAVYEILVTVANTGCLHEGDRYGLMAACLDEDLTEEERRAINRILRSVARGKVVIA